MTAENIRYLVTGKLAPLGVLLAAPPGQDIAGRGAVPGPAPRVNLLLGLRIRGVLLRPRAAGAAGWALAWLHYPPLAAAVLAGFAVTEAWLFGVHGVIGPMLAVLRDPVLFAAVAALTLASLVFHEFGHASACRYGGARPGAIGFGVYLIWPALHTDVTDAYRLDRAGRLRTDLGGVYFNAIFILALAGCYAATGQPVFLAAVFFGNFEILQQLVPLVRMDGYFILGDLADLADLPDLLGPILASVLPGAAARRAAARASGLRRGPRGAVTTWVLLAVPLLATAAGYTLWYLPVMATTAARSFTTGLAAVRAGFTTGHPMHALAGLLAMLLLIIPALGLACLLGTATVRAAAAAARHARRLAASLPSPAVRVRRATLLVLGMAGLAVGLTLLPSRPHGHPAAAAAPSPREQRSGVAPRTYHPPTSPPGHQAPGTAAPRPAAAAPVTGGTSQGWPAAGQRLAVSPGAVNPGGSPAPGSPRPSRPAVAPTSPPAPPSPKPPGRSPPPGGRPAPSPSCTAQLDVLLLRIGLLCH